MAATNSVEARQALKGGAVAGLIGGAVLDIFMVAMSMIRGKDIWYPLKGAAFPFLGDVVYAKGFAAVPVILGILCHFAVAIGWGLLFGVLFYGMTKWATMLMGMVWGIVVWLVMFYAVLPIVGAGSMMREASTARAIVYHLLFGISVGLGFLPFQRTRVHTATRTHRHHVPLASP